MRLKAGLLLVGLGFCLAAQAQPYRAPEGNCDASVMSLETARMASMKAEAAAKPGAAACTATAQANVAAWLAAANGLQRRATGLLAACPGMDDAMAQGEKMAKLAGRQIAEAAEAQKNATACGQAK